MKLTKKLAVKIITMSFCALFLLTSLVACSEDDKKSDDAKKDSSTEMTTKKSSEKKGEDQTEMTSGMLDEVETERYTKKAQEDITLLNDGKLDEVEKQFNEVAKKATTEKVSNEITEIITNAGQFEKFEKTIVKEDAGIYLTETIAKYSKTELTISIQYDGSSGKIVSLEFV